MPILHKQCPYCSDQSSGWAQFIPIFNQQQVCFWALTRRSHQAREFFGYTNSILH